MERSHVKLTQWAAAFHLYTPLARKALRHSSYSAKSAVEYNTAWFMHHRIMRSDAPRRA